MLSNEEFAIAFVTDVEWDAFHAAIAGTDGDGPGRVTGRVTAADQVDGPALGGLPARQKSRSKAWTSSNRRAPPNS